MLCPMNDLMYYGRLAWTGLVDIHEENKLNLEGSCYVLLLRSVSKYLLVSMLFRMLS